MQHKQMRHTVAPAKSQPSLSIVSIDTGPPPPLSPDECRRLRLMLAQFDAIKQQCPMARKIISQE